MKKAILFVLILSATTANGQKLKDLLYGGKLKKDSSGVIRRTDDLSSKIDTSQKKIEPGKPKSTTTVIQDGSTNKGNTNANPATATVNTNNTTPASVTTKSVAPAKSNTKIWKEYTDSLTVSLKKELLSSKKVKKETYFFTVEYEIGTDGATNITNVIVSPENAFLAASVKQIVESTPPLLNPVLNSAKQPQKVKRKHNFSVTKE
ncbi:MAG: hypothetical protein ABR502_10175 [Chitinophagaceae bacterium]